jgi:hypothetical protein
MLGACAEIAYSEVTGQEMDLNLYKGGDTVDFGGIELKSSTWPYDDIELKVKQSEYSRKYKNTKAYTLCRVDKDLNWVEFIGSISVKRFDELKKTKTHKKVANWTVDAKDLPKKLAYLENGEFKFLKIENEG